MHDWSELARRAAAGDREAQGALLEPYLGRLRAFIRVQAGPLIRAHESVSDLVQSVCREILNDFGDVELTDEDALRRWMFLTADRKLKDRARRYGAEKRGGGRPLVVHESWSHIDQAALDSYAQLVGPIDAAIAAETQARIESALQRLSEEDRRVILMTRIQRISHAEVAEALGRSPTYTRLLLYRALARLAKAMDAP